MPCFNHLFLYNLVISQLSEKNQSNLEKLYPSTIRMMTLHIRLLIKHLSKHKDKILPSTEIIYKVNLKFYCAQESPGESHKMKILIVEV